MNSKKLTQAPPKIAVVGTGAMGSVFSGLLASAGNDVWAIDLNEPHISAIRKQGLRVEGASGDRIVHDNLQASTAVLNVGECDLIILATKAYDVVAATQSILPIMTPDTLVLGMQNGYGSANRISQYLPTENILLGIAGGFGASLRGLAHAHHNGMAMINLGEMSGGLSERLTWVADIWSGAGFNVKQFENIDQLIWEKLIINCTFSAPSTVFNRTVRELLDDADSRRIALGCGREAWEVANALGVPITYRDPEAYLLNFAQGVLNAKPSMLQDYLAQRRSEIDVINGAIPDVAKGLGLAVPYNRTTTAIVRKRESMYL